MLVRNFTFLIAIALLSACDNSKPAEEIAQEQHSDSITKANVDKTEDERREKALQSSPVKIVSAEVRKSVNGKEVVIQVHNPTDKPIKELKLYISLTDATGQEVKETYIGQQQHNNIAVNAHSTMITDLGNSTAEDVKAYVFKIVFEDGTFWRND